jgi:hypothetical protein
MAKLCREGIQTKIEADLIANNLRPALADIDGIFKILHKREAIVEIEMMGDARRVKLMLELVEKM